MSYTSRSNAEFRQRRINGPEPLANRRSPLFWLLAAGLLCIFPCTPSMAAQTHHATAAQREAAKPLSKAGLEKALRIGGMKSPEFVAIIHKRGVDFRLDHDTELELRGAGADANILEAVSENYRPPPGATEVATAHPPAAGNVPAAVGPTRVAPPPRPEPPPAPTFRDVTLPAGTVLSVQITQTLDSGSTPPGQAFNGILSQDIIVGNMVAVPHGAAVLGRVTEAKDAAHFAGSSKLTLELSSLTLPGAGGSPVPVTTAPVSKEGTGRGRSTAARAGGGAAVGAVLGGIFGGGKGAAIGAAAGGGAGAGSSAITKGQQVQFTSESIVPFTLSSPVLVRISLVPGAPAPPSPRQPLRN